MNYFNANSQEKSDSPMYPSIHHNLSKDELGPYFLVRGKKYYHAAVSKGHGLSNIIGNPVGNENGI